MCCIKISRTSQLLLGCEFLHLSPSLYDHSSFFNFFFSILLPLTHYEQYPLAEGSTTTNDEKIKEKGLYIGFLLTYISVLPYTVFSN